MKHNFLNTFLGSIFFCAAFALQIAANQSQLLKTSVEGLSSSGTARDIHCRLRVYNPNPIAVTVSLPPVNSRFGYQAASTPASAPIPSHGEAFFDVRISITADGEYQVLIPMNITDSRGGMVGSVQKDLYFRVQRGRYTVSNFRELFVQPIAVESDDSGERTKVFRTQPPPVGWPNSPDFNLVQPTIDELEAVRRETVYETDWSGSETRSGSRSTWSSLNGDESYAQETLMEKVNAPAAPQGATFKAQGKLVYSGLDGMLHPAYGWRVYVYAIPVGTSIKYKLGKTNAKSDGNWEIDVPYMPFPIRIEYHPRNYFYSFADVTDNTWYSFTSGTHSAVAPGATINEYTQSVYSANSDLVGLGDLYRDGMRMLVALGGKGGGISPGVDETIPVYYPNDNYDCGHGDNVPWSCASSQGFIWIIPEHAAGRAVMIHELSHQMHGAYWGSIPGAASPQPILTCIDRGPALVEGFANFMVHWVRFSRSSVPSGNSTLAVETPVGACQTDSLNQLWVTATLWDMYDSVDDGSDTRRFTKEGAPVAIFLANDGPDGMDEFRPIFMQKAGSSGSLWVHNTFNQNNQD